MKLTYKLNSMSFVCIIVTACLCSLYTALRISVQTAYYLFAVLVVLLLNLGAKKEIIVLSAIGFLFGICISLQTAKSSCPFKSLVPDEDICLVQGIVLSDPVPKDIGSYGFTFKVEFAKSENIISSAMGKSTVFVKADLIEKPEYEIALTRQKQNRVMIEQGARFYFTGRYSSKNNSFYADKAVFLGWNKEIYKMRAHMRLRLKKTLFSWGDAGTLLLALVTGTREFVPIKLRNNFTQTGIAHILALSGMHLAIIGGFVKKLFKPFLGYNAAMLLTILACGFFLWFAGISPSLLRAFLCLVISSLFELWGIGVKKITVLALSFLIQLVLFPEHCLALSFMLSYTGLVGIYLFMDFFKWIYTGYLRLPKKLAESLAVSTAAQIGILPISFICLKQIVPIGIFTTLCVSPFISLFFIFGIFGILFSLVFQGTGAIFSFLLNVIYAIICRIIDFFTLFPPVNL